MITEEQRPTDAELEWWAEQYSADEIQQPLAAIVARLIAEVRRLRAENEQLTRLVGNNAADAALHGAKIGGSYKRRKSDQRNTTQWDTP